MHHLAVVVADLDASEGFYRGILGLEPLKRWSDERGQPRSVWLGLGGGAFLALEKGDPGQAHRADTAPGWHCVALAIDPSERATWRARLEEAGHPVFRESPYTLFVRDPDGCIVALSHYPEEA